MTPLWMVSGQGHVGGGNCTEFESRILNAGKVHAGLLRKGSFGHPVKPADIGQVGWHGCTEVCGWGWGGVLLSVS